MRIKALYWMFLMVLFTIAQAPRAQGQAVFGGGVGVSGMLQFTDKSHNPALLATMIIAATAPKQSRTIGTVNNGNPIATEYVDLNYGLVLDNIEMRDVHGEYVHMDIHPDVPSTNVDYHRAVAYLAMQPSFSLYTGVGETTRKQPRMFRAITGAGELKAPNGYTLTISIRAAKHSSGRFVIFGWGSRSGEVIQASFHLMIKECRQPANEAEMASQLQGFNILVAQPDPAQAGIDPVVGQLQSEVQQLRDELQKARTEKPTPKQEDPRRSEWTVKTTVKIRMHDGVHATGRPYPVDSRFVVHVMNTEPTKDTYPRFGIHEPAPEDWRDANTTKGECTVRVPIKAYGDVYIVVWVEGYKDWLTPKWVKVDPSVTSKELTFWLTVPEGR